MLKRQDLLHDLQTINRGIAVSKFDEGRINIVADILTSSDGS